MLGGCMGTTGPEPGPVTWVKWPAPSFWKYRIVVGVSGLGRDHADVDPVDHEHRVVDGVVARTGQYLLSAGAEQHHHLDRRLFGGTHLRTFAGPKPPAANPSRTVTVQVVVVPSWPSVALSRNPSPSRSAMIGAPRVAGGTGVAAPTAERPAAVTPLARSPRLPAPPTRLRLIGTAARRLLSDEPEPQEAWLR
jgi:hypothetical protein